MRTAWVIGGVVLGAVVVAGVLGTPLAAQPDHVEGGSFEYADRSGFEWGEPSNATAVVTEGEFYTHPIYVRSNLETFRVSVTAETPVDVYLLNGTGLEAYREKESFEAVASLTETATATLTARPAQGRYTLVIDNSGAFGATPNGSVTVKLTVVRTQAS